MAGVFAPEMPGASEVGLLLRRALLDGVAFCTPPFCVGEFWRFATEPKGYSRPASRTIEFLGEWLSLSPMVQLTSAYVPALLAELERLQPVGAGVFDVCIGVSAREAGAEELWTLDRRFPEIAGMTIVRRPLIERL